MQCLYHIYSDAVIATVKAITMLNRLVQPTMTGYMATEGLVRITLNDNVTKGKGQTGGKTRGKYGKYKNKIGSFL